MAKLISAIIGVNQILSTIKTNSYYLPWPFIRFRHTTTNCAFCI